MKTSLLICNLIFGLIVSLIISNSIFAQSQTQENLPTAYINKELYLRLDDNAPQNSKIFEADISKLQLTTIEQAKRFFGFFNDSSVQFEPNITTQKVIVTLIPNEEKQNWTLSEWGMYFKNKVSLQRKQSGTYIDFTKK